MIQKLKNRIYEELLPICKSDFSSSFIAQICNSEKISITNLRNLTPLLPNLINYLDYKKNAQLTNTFTRFAINSDDAIRELQALIGIIALNEIRENCESQNINEDVRFSTSVLEGKLLNILEKIVPLPILVDIDNNIVKLREIFQKFEQPYAKKFFDIEELVDLCAKTCIDTYLDNINSPAIEMLKMLNNEYAKREQFIKLEKIYLKN